MRTVGSRILGDRRLMMAGDKGEKAKLDGTPVRTILSFEMVGLGAEAAAAPNAAGPSTGGGPVGPGLFSATNEIVKASAAAKDVAIPAGFRQK